MSNNNQQFGSFHVFISFFGLIFLLLICFGGWYGCKRMQVWSAQIEGKAELARAEQNRNIRIAEAKANLEAEKLNAQAEVERAKGAAAAIEIENGKLTDTYIKYLWVRQQGNLSDNVSVIYVPTEGNVPVLEAGRRPVPYANE